MRAPVCVHKYARSRMTKKSFIFFQFSKKTQTDTTKWNYICFLCGISSQSYNRMITIYEYWDKNVAQWCWNCHQFEMKKKLILSSHYVIIKFKMINWMKNPKVKFSFSFTVWQQHNTCSTEYVTSVKLKTENLSFNVSMKYVTISWFKTKKLNVEITAWIITRQFWKSFKQIIREGGQLSEFRSPQNAPKPNLTQTKLNFTVHLIYLQ